MERSESTPQSLRQLYRDTYKPLVAALTLATGHREDAEEIAQEAFTRLIPRWAQVSEFDDPAAWVRMVAFRVVSDRRRRLVRRPRAWANTYDMNAVDRDSAMDIRQAVVQLPISHRQVVLLHYVYDLRIEDIAKILDVRTGTVKSRLGRARATLYRILNDGAPNG